MNFVQCNLGTGVRLYLCETDKFKSVTCKVFIQQDLDLKSATSTALIPLILPRGSQRFPSTLQIARELEYLYAAEMSSDVLKIGERQILEFHFQMIDPALLPQKEEHLKRGLSTFWNIITCPADGNGAFNDTYFKQEKQTLRKQLEGLINNKRAYALARFAALMCENEPFGIYKYGDLGVLEKLENQEAFRHYQKLCFTYPMDIFLVGPDIDVAANLLSNMAAGRKGQQKLQMPQPVEVNKPRFFQEALDVQQAVLVIGFRTNCSYLNENYYALLVGSGILGGFPHSKLFVNVREKAGLAYYIDSSIEGSKGLLTVSAGINAEQRDQTLEIIKKQLEDVQKGRFSAEELEQAKRGLASAVVSMADHPSGLIDRNLIGIVHGEIRPPDTVAGAIRAVQHSDVVKVMNDVVLDTIYMLGPRGKAGEN